MLPLALFGVLLLVLFRGMASFEVQTWTYNATLFWAPLFKMHPLHGHQLAALAAQITRLTFGLVEAIHIACIEPSGPCPGYGHCDKESMVAEVNARRMAFHSNVEGIIQQLTDNAIQNIALAMLGATAELGSVPRCKALAEGLSFTSSDAQGCVPLVPESMSCARGISEVARASMAELHAAQIAAVSMPVSLADVGMPRPETAVFDVARGLVRAEILASFLLEALGTTNVQDPRVTAELQSGPFVAQVLAADVGDNDGSMSESLLKRVPGLRLLLIGPCELATKARHPARDITGPEARGEGMADALWDRMRPFRNRSVIVCQRSVDAAAFVAPDSLDLVFIDGDHDYGAVREHVRLWRPKLRIGGVLAGHDYNLFFPGTIRAVHEFAFDTRATLTLGPDHMWWFQL